MYFIKFLQTADHTGEGVEYRLACSGAFYNRRVQTFDWRKSDATRLLLPEPFSLQVASRPFDSYPQELSMRFAVGFATEQSSNVRYPGSTFSTTFLPDEDIVEDVCSILTLLSRRLVTRVAKTMQTPGIVLPKTQSWPLQLPVPMPILDGFKVAAWPRRQLTITTTMTGSTVKFNEPPPVGVDHEALGDFLADLAKRKDAQDIIYAAKQYKTALELIGDRPDTAYLALVSVIETFANLALRKFKPEESKRIADKANVVELARKFGLDEAQANQLALAATERNSWLTQKFVKFCMDYCPVSELSGPDPVFMVPEFIKPSEADFEKCLKRIYSARSKNLHIAAPFPPGAGIGTTLGINARDFHLALSGKVKIPPVTWFERVVSVAARRYLIGDRDAPFIEEPKMVAARVEAKGLS